MLYPTSRTVTCQLRRPHTVAVIKPHAGPCLPLLCLLLSLECTSRGSYNNKPEGCFELLTSAAQGLNHKVDFGAHLNLHTI